MIKPSRREAWVVEFFPAIHLITQEIPELGGLVDAARPSASCSMASTLCLTVFGMGLLTHAHNSHRLMLVTLRGSQGELEMTLLAKGIDVG